MGRSQVIRRFMESEYAKNRWPDISERRKHARAFADAEVDLDDSMGRGFVVDLSDYEFDAKADEPTWLHAVTLGTYDHPMYGEIEFTPEKIKRYADNVVNKVLEIDPDIDYEHKRSPEGGRAAGWVVAAEARLDEKDESKRGLWTLVDWTPRARAALADKEYRYFSPELADEWRHPKKGTIYKDVFMGGAITNRPFLKDLTPLNFDDALQAWEQQLGNDKGEVDGVKLEDILALLSMSRQEATAALSLSADATDEDIIAAAKTRLLAAPAPEPPAPDPISKAFAEQFPEEAERMRKLEEENAANTARLLEAQTDAVLADFFDGRLTLEADGKQVRVQCALPPVVRDSVREFRLSLSTDSASKFDDILRSILKAGVIELSSIGSSDVPEAAADADVRMVKRVKELQAESEKNGKTLSFSDAVREVAKADPELAREWRSSKRQASGE